MQYGFVKTSPFIAGNSGCATAIFYTHDYSTYIRRLIDIKMRYIGILIYVI